MTNEQLVALIQSGDNVTDNMLKLWEQNQGLIAKVALKYSGYEDIEDLKQQGYIALYSAANTYRSDEGTLFSTYAVHLMKQSMTRYIEECGSTVRIPGGTKRLVAEYKRFTAAMYAAYGRNPSDDETMLYLAINKERMDQLKQGLIFTQMKSIDVSVSDDDTYSLGDLIPGSTDVESEVLDDIHICELRAVIGELVSSLPVQEQDIITERFWRGKTRKEISSATGTPESKVRNLEYNALWHMRHGKGTRQLESLWEESSSAIASKAMQGTGVKRFEQTWTSATERVALDGYSGIIGW